MSFFKKKQVQNLKINKNSFSNNRFTNNCQILLLKLYKKLNNYFFAYRFLFI